MQTMLTEECGNEISKSASKAFDAFSCLNEAEHADTQKGEAKQELRIKQFKEWMDEYSIWYPDEETRQYRFSIFKANVELHGHTYPEYRAALDAACHEDLVRSLRPSKIDWVEAGVVSPVVRTQNGCGCCWAMATVGSVEAVHRKKTKQSIALSVQELIDCNTKNNGCEGGDCHYALEYIQKNGLSSESSYPYTYQASVSGCKRNKTVAARISGLKHVGRTEDALEEAVAKQPVVVSLQASSQLMSYRGGIMEYEALPETLPDGSKTSRHAVLIVGYGTDPNGVSYWRFKNSWGKGWGEEGFGRIRRHVADERGALGMFMRPAIYPVLNI